MNSKYKNILAAVDLERSSNLVLVAAARLAQEHRTGLCAMAAVRPELLSTKGFFSAEFVDRKALLQEAREAMQARTSVCAVEPVWSDVLIGDPGEKIVEVAKLREADLVVIGARARSTSERFFGTTATEVLRHARGIDIYACHRSNPQSPTERVVLAIDGTAMSQEVLSDSARLLATTQDGVSPDVLVVCILPSEFGHQMTALRQRCQTYLQNSGWAHLDLRLEVGNVADRLDAVIQEWDADLLVIGSGENLGFGGAVGSTTNKVLHEVCCDVLVVRS